MHRVDFASNRPVFSLYNPQDRQREAPEFTWQYLLRTAKHIASVVEAMHSRGYVVGDLNESNILVANTAMVTLIDCDSIQVPRPGTGMFFRCPVGKAEYTPPELQGCEFGRIDRVNAHDDFSLGVLTFQLLMEGTHPFSGVWQAEGDPPPIEERIRIGASPYSGTSSAMPMPGAPPFGMLPSELQTLFQRCFRDGHHSPGSRPTPREWNYALDVAEAKLRKCSRSPRHTYSGHLASCPWCDRTRLLGGFDPFPVSPQPRPTRQPGFVVPQPGQQTVAAARSPLASAAIPTIQTTTHVATVRAPNWTQRFVVGLSIVLASIFGFRFVVDQVTTSRRIAAQAAEQARAQAAEQARNAEAIRTAERARVEQGIVGAWSSQTFGTLRITKDRGRLRAEIPVQFRHGPMYPLQRVVQVLHGEILTDNQVKLVNDNRGKLVNPAIYYSGPFSDQIWIDVSPDGRMLTVRFAESRSDASVVMWKRGSTPAQATVVESSTAQSTSGPRDQQVSEKESEAEEQKKVAAQAADERARQERETSERERAEELRREEQAAAQRKEDEELQAALLEERRQEEAAKEASARAALLAVVWTDRRTGLMWTREDNGSGDIDWDQARGYCASLILGGYSDWRLPEIDELERLYDPTIAGTFRVVSPLQLNGCCAWSSTMYRGYRDSGTSYPCAWYYNFGKGKRKWHTTGLDLFVRFRALCVRRTRERVSNTHEPARADHQSGAGQRAIAAQPVDDRSDGQTNERGNGNSLDVLSAAVDRGDRVAWRVKYNGAIPGYTYLYDATIIISKTSVIFEPTGPAGGFEVTPDKLLEVSNQPEPGSRLHLKVLAKGEGRVFFGKELKDKERKRLFDFYDTNAVAVGTGPGGTGLSVACTGCDDSMVVLGALLRKVKGNE